MTSREPTKTPKMPASCSRRIIIQGGTAAAIGLGLGASRSALAAPGLKKKSKARPASKSGMVESSKSRPTATKAKGPAGPASPLIDPVSAKNLSAEERALAKAIAASVKHAIASAAVEPPDTRFARGSYARIAQGYVKSLPVVARRGAVVSARKLMAAPMPKRRKVFGSLAAHNADVHRRPLKPVRPTIARAAKDQAMRRVMKLVPAKTASQGMKVVAPRYRRVEFYLNEVKCIEETNEIGADHIKIAGTAISPQGVITKIKPFTVSRDFDEGETISYYPLHHPKFRGSDPFRGRPLASFALSGPTPSGPPTANTPPSSFPCGFGLFLCMGEVDDGGFAGLVSKLWAAIGNEVRGALEAIIGSVAGLFGPLIAELIASIIHDVIGFIINLFDNEDDWVDGISGNLALPSANKSFFEGLGGRESDAPDNVWAAQRQVWRFEGDGGYYRAKMHWRVSS